ncbi:helix-turn-helix transcriptional regulator [uncultured Akkermansia sp.]|uniref:helix-turn-helix domain-containing protein n=1 Tax=uncultured Akkermansia sp. TaxID=512294 RepID=UPI0025FE9884|nr:helix-turn-helix transcriptional regulator [uncultured Akkermansia sp.]
MLSAEVVAGSEALYSNSIVARTLMSMRVGAGLSQSEMARKVGCTQPRISNIKSATDDRLNIPVIRLYCAILRKPFRAQLADGTKIHVPVPKLERTFLRLPGKTGKDANPRKSGNKPVSA